MKNDLHGWLFTFDAPDSEQHHEVAVCFVLLFILMCD